MSFEEAKQFLRAEDGDGSSLYEHLSKLLLKVIVEKPANANAMFEQMSQELRSSTYVKPPLKPEGEEDIVSQEKEHQLKWCAAASKLYVSPDEGEATFPDLMTEAHVFEWCGVSFGKTETYRLYLAVKALALRDGLALRFWGKIAGRGGDYYVAQGPHPEPPQDVRLLEGAEGANKYAFWVCAFPGGPWTRLPDATPESLVVARQVRRFFTGDLAAPVPSYPPFPGGTEAHLLRAQLALITAECAISPAGFYADDEEAAEGTKGIKRVEEMETPKSADELKDASAWVKHEVQINVNGRCNQPPADDDAAAEPADELPDLPTLASISDDTLGDDAAPAWAISAAPSGAGESPDSCVVVKSLKWPGAFAAAFGNKFINVYSGFGTPSLRGLNYEPPRVPKICPEWAPEAEDDKGLVEDEDKTTAPPVAEAEEEE